VNDDVLPIQIRRRKILGFEVDRSSPGGNVRATSCLASNVCGWRHNFVVEPLVIVGGYERLSELGQMGVQPAADGVLGPLFAMQDPAEIELDLMFRLKSQRDGQLHAGTQGSDLVELGVAELSVFDEYA
jgi:hypothetical protein